MSDRVKYFLLGLLFLVVAGVIAFDRLNNTNPAPNSTEVARENANAGETWIKPPLKEPKDDPKPNFGERFGKRDPAKNDSTGPGLIIDPNAGRGAQAKKNDTPAIIPPVNRTPDPKPEPKPEPVGASKTHVVRSGETLESISKRHYPGQVYRGIKLISSANNIRNPNHISINQRLIIPAMDSRGTRQPTVARQPNTGGIPSTYTVRSSDADLYAICRRFYGRAGEGKRTREIMKLNGLVSVYVEAGTKLKLPPK